jgi:hypothetical protein
MKCDVFVQRGGRTIYAGPLGKQSKDLVAYFEAIPGVPAIKGSINPATWMLEVSTPGMEERMHVSFADLYDNSGVFGCVRSEKKWPEGKRGGVRIVASTRTQRGNEV